MNLGSAFPTMHLHHANKLGKRKKRKKERKLGFENQKTEVESVFYLAAGDCRSNG
jgi:hypothetical protein